jgi:ADP-ribose pyrophosphatase YjhB (NUDIX family)
MDVIEHHIQRDILDRLISADTLRFSELKPAGMESNIFMYHLKHLLGAGFIDKHEGRYMLAPKGLSYADQLSSTNNRPRKQPKIVAMFVLTSADGKVLLSRRLRQPFRGYYSFPCGKQHIGETLAEHARREKQEKLGAEVVTRYRGMCESLIEADKTPIFHTINYIFSAELAAAEPIDSPDERFELVWVPLDKVPEMKVVPGVTRILELTLQPDDVLFMDSLRSSL